MSDGQGDYSYLSPGSGQAPLARYDQTSTRATYLATDLLGSVRLATDPANLVLGAGSYDAWGNARPNPGSNGATLLAGLQAASPFRYAGQQYDAGPGTYAMRARSYDPSTGRFLSQDPQAYDPQLPVTINRYEYALDEPTYLKDPSGQYALWGSNCFRGGNTLDGPGGIIYGHDLAESAYLLLQQEHGNNRAACEFDIAFGSRNGVAAPNQATLPFPDYVFLPRTGHADIVDDYKGNGSGLWEFEPLTDPNGMSKARDEALHYVKAAASFRRCIPEPVTRFRAFGPVEGSTVWSGPISFHVGDPALFPGSVYVPARPPAEGRDGYLYDVAIGPWLVAKGALWFDVFRSRKAKSNVQDPKHQPSFVELTNPAGQWVRLTAITIPDLAGRGLSSEPVTYLPQVHIPSSNCGVLGCVWNLLEQGVGSGQHGLVWVGTHPAQLTWQGLTVTAIGSCAVGGCGAAIGATIGSLVSIVGSAVLGSSSGVAEQRRVIVIRSSSSS